MSEPEAPPPDSAHSLTAISTDRWRIEPLPGGGFLLRAITEAGPSDLPVDTLHLGRDDLEELGNLFTLASDMLSDSPLTELSPRIEFVVGFDANAKVLFSTTGQPPAEGSRVQLPGDERLFDVVRHSWKYVACGPAVVRVRLQEWPRVTAKVHPATPAPPS